MKRLFSFALAALILSAFTTIPLDKKKGKITVVVDAGHGGKDPGNNAQGINESDVNLQIALALKNVKKKKGIEIIYTRKDDSFLELHDRTNIAQDKKADLLISVHCDNYSDEELNGFQIFYPNTGNYIVESKNFAADLEKELVNLNTPIPHKSTKSGSHFVTNKAKCPAVIVELGFMSNPTDLQVLTSEDYQKQFAEAIVTSIKTYIED
jgi:N-acetylmuramoyl-L-alanine amidase